MRIRPALFSLLALLALASSTRLKELEERLQSATAPDAKTALETDLKRVRDELKAAEEKASAAKKELEEARRELDKRRLRKEVASTELDLATRSAATGTNLLAVARSELDAAQLQHQAAGQRLAEAKTAPLTRSSPATTLAFSPHARLATGHSNGWVRLWHPDTGEWIDTLHLHNRPIRAITWTSPSILMAADDRGRWKRTRLHPEIRLLRRLGTGDGRSPIVDRVTALAFSPDGTRLASGGGEPSRSGEIKFWSVPAGRLLANWTNAHSDTVVSLAFDRDGARLASGGTDRFARILDVQTGKILRNFEGHTHHVLSVAWHRNNRVVATAGADRVVKTWDVRSGERRKNFTGADKEVVGATYVGFTDRLIRASAEGKIVLLDENGKDLRPFEGPTDYLQSIALSADGNWLAAGGADGILWCWDIESGKPRAQFEAPAPATR